MNKYFLQIIFPFSLLLVSVQGNAQNSRLFKQTVECYCLPLCDSNTESWKKIDCTLNKASKKEIIKLQTELQSLNYEVDITGIADEKTQAAYLKEKEIRNQEKQLKKKKKKK